MKPFKTILLLVTPHVNALVILSFFLTWTFSVSVFSCLPQDHTEELASFAHSVILIHQSLSVHLLLELTVWDLKKSFPNKLLECISLDTQDHKHAQPITAVPH
jgi:hypothetical protein